MVDAASLRPNTNRPQFGHPPEHISLKPDYRNSIGRKITMGTDRVFYETEAQRSITPFMYNNAVQDARTNVQGRAYLCAPNGDTYYTRQVDIAKRHEIPIPDRYETYIGIPKGKESREDSVRFGPKRARVRGDVPTPYPTGAGTSDQNDRGHFTQPERGVPLRATGL